MATEKWLISAWDLIEWLNNIDLENMHRVLKGKKAKWIDTKGIRHMIDTVPRVDAIEVVHGEWSILEDDYGCEFMRCSVCEAEFYDGDNDTVDHMHNYCPHCGAKMRGDGNG